MATFAAGGYECELIADGHGVLPPEMAFANAPARNATQSWRIDWDNRGAAIPYGCLLIGPPTDGADGMPDRRLRTPGRRTRRRARGGARAARRAPGEIQLVPITHSHLDHIGGLWADGPRASAPRAT